MVQISKSLAVATLLFAPALGAPLIESSAPEDLSPRAPCGGRPGVRSRCRPNAPAGRPPYRMAPYVHRPRPVGPFYRRPLYLSKRDGELEARTPQAGGKKTPIDWGNVISGVSGAVNIAGAVASYLKPRPPPPPPAPPAQGQPPAHGPPHQARGLEGDSYFEARNFGYHADPDMYGRQMLEELGELLARGRQW
ncbi:hypothetical protein CC1G_08897 [Coprinopsis cinerea okayama7|uniref:Uncharacterized protein n=1 Tax=Coprinopsis cinerea (strain Okayama-7 / 130 / ATCC MYA-4618 / FGSC 9003) TaxID=240176 RepID=A8P885_COPC7|nr:hypothetical protein CC1G_08897 [Coprinopsis cinerea okayama7\|eukprot:XP_001839518.1 hypothetical protein CC1G_08897 [Coprinopsis cinerea okayama7\